MVPRDAVTGAGGPARSCRRRTESRSVCDPPERDASWRICPHLQLPGQSQGEPWHSALVMIMTSEQTSHASAGNLQLFQDFNQLPVRNINTWEYTGKYNAIY